MLKVIGRCETCGIDIYQRSPKASRTRRWCSDQCTPPCVAEGCDRQPETRINLCLRHYKRLKRNGSLDLADQSTCSACGVSIPRTSANGPTANRCSDCQKPREPALRTCAFCGSQFDRAGTNRQWCSTLCRQRAGRRAAQTHTHCQSCGTELDFLSVGAGGRAKRIDAAYCGHCRRDVRYGATVADLVARDGAACSLCGEVVDLDVKWPHPMSATRDHVVPYSLGGSNAAENLALAHAVCNTRKRNRVEVSPCSPSARPSPASAPR